MSVDPATIKAVITVAQKVMSDKRVRNIAIGAVITPLIIILMILSSPMAIFFAIIGDGTASDSIPATRVIVDLKNQLSLKVEKELKEDVDEIHLIVKGDINEMRVLIVEPQKEPYEADINNSLESMQKVVGGLIEPIEIDENVTLVCDEEGKFKELEGNRRVGKDDIIAGTFFICGCNYEGEFISLTDEQARRYHERFKEPEEYTQAEVEEGIYVEVYPYRSDSNDFFEDEEIER